MKLLGELDANTIYPLISRLKCSQNVDMNLGSPNDQMVCCFVCLLKLVNIILIVTLSLIAEKSIVLPSVVFQSHLLDSFKCHILVNLYIYATKTFSMCM